MSLFQGRVAWQVDGLHTIKQGRGNCIQAIRCGDEKNLAQVNWNVDVVISKCVILFRIKDLKHSSRRITMEVRRATQHIRNVKFLKMSERIYLPHFVDLVEKEHRVCDANLLEAIYD